jgi:hypothetical protein
MMHNQSVSWARALILSVVFCFGVSALAATEGAPKSYASSLDFGFDAKYMMAKYPSLSWDAGTLYDQKGDAAQFSLDWLPIGSTPYGKPGLGVSFGYVFYYKVPSASEMKALLGSIQVSYRLELMKNQLLVPFVKYGFSAGQVTQTPAATGHSSANMYYGIDLSLGIELNLNSLEPSAGNYLDATMGINGVYLVFEYLISNALNKGTFPDMSGNQLLGGIRFEF